MTRSLTLAVAIVICAPSIGFAAEPSKIPKPVPATRPELKRALEALKSRDPRLPLESSFAGAAGAGLLPKTWGSGGGLGIGSDIETGLDGQLLDCCFWVVSRGNNCHYCLGHQELKLQFIGLDDNTIAALDSDWSGFTPREQAAMKFARRLTLEPQSMGDADIAALKKHFSDREIIELAFTISRFNATNRWTDGVGLPQEAQFGDGRKIELDTPTSEKFQRTKSIVASVTPAMRPTRETWEEVESKIEARRSAEPRVMLPAAASAKAALADSIGDRAPLVWEQALATLPVNGPAFVNIWNSITTDDNLSPRLKSEIAFITAVHNNAWYAAAHAASRLKQLGASPADLTALLQDHDHGKSGAEAVYHLAAKCTREPQRITDADVAAVRAHFSDRETAEILQVICMANLFDRFTESLGLPVDVELGQD